MHSFVKEKTIELLKEYENIQKQRGKRAWAKDREKASQHLIKAGEAAAVIKELEKVKCK